MSKDAPADKRWVDPITAALVGRIERRRYNSAIERRAAFGIVEGWVGLCLNAVLFVAKLAIGLMIGSVALIADAVHTLADSLTSAVLIIGSRIARRPADREHPYGHGRIEAVAAVVIAVLLGVAGIEFTKTSIERILEPSPVDASWLIVGVVVGFALIKEWNARFALTLARRSGSLAIEADAWHHRSDVFATLLVAGGIVGAKLGVPILDSVMAIGVSLVILYTAYALARESVDPLIGKAPSSEEIAEVAQTAMSIDGVDGVHDIVIHNYGGVQLVSLHIETSADKSPLELHGLAEIVQNLVSGGRKGHVVVHVDPIDRSHPSYERVSRAVHEIAASEERLCSIHDLRLEGEEDDLTLAFDMVLQPDTEDVDELKNMVVERVKQQTGATTVNVEVEPLFAYGSEAS